MLKIFYNLILMDVYCDYEFILIILCTGLLICLMCAIASQIKNLNHNLYFVFKANGMIGYIDEKSILFTKLDKKC